MFLRPPGHAVRSSRAPRSCFGWLGSCARVARERAVGMPVETQELLVFHAVVKHSNYAKAADELGLSPSGVSRIVSRLEERLGARLIQRTTRKLKLTEVGEAFHARTSQVMSDLRDAELEVQQTVLRPRGTIRISTSVAF